MRRDKYKNDYGKNLRYVRGVRFGIKLFLYIKNNIKQERVCVCIWERENLLSNASEGSRIRVIAKHAEKKKTTRNKKKEFIFDVSCIK